MRVKAIACGLDFVLCLTPTGQVFSKGLGSRGQLGLGDLDDRERLTLIEALQVLTVVAVSAGNWHALCLTDTGDVYSWGWNEHGQLGHKSFSLRKKLGYPREALADSISVLASPKPVEIPEDERVIQISCGARHSACLTDHNHVYVFGWNGFGQLGVDPNGDAIDTPTLVNPGFGEKTRSITSVRCGTWSTTLVLENAIA
ncbi:unnamed protein product [Calicophoron daubneyi]|uniref:Uncharacterized protein n=1 Tax=Calicophoron daubneyi TaxID=300641 RepID=A0AAV2SXY7_CALDB